MSNSLKKPIFFSKIMIIITFIIVFFMYLFNFICWFYPEIGFNQLGFSFSASILHNLQIDLQTLSFGQFFGGMIISTIPLIALTATAFHLFCLFRLFTQNNYFSYKIANHLEKAGFFIVIWVILQFFSEPILGFLLTFNAPENKRIITLSLEYSDFIALFLSGFFWIIANILKKASFVYNENQSFL